MYINTESQSLKQLNKAVKRSNLTYYENKCGCVYNCYDFFRFFLFENTDIELVPLILVLIYVVCLYVCETKAAISWSTCLQRWYDKSFLRDWIIILLKYFTFLVFRNLFEIVFLKTVFA